MTLNSGRYSSVMALPDRRDPTLWSGWPLGRGSEGSWRLRVAGGPRLHGLQVEGLGSPRGRAAPGRGRRSAGPSRRCTARRGPGSPRDSSSVWSPKRASGCPTLVPLGRRRVAWPARQPPPRAAPPGATAEGYLPAPVLVGDGAPVQLKPIEAHGAGVAVVFPGDRLWAGEIEVPVGADGVALLRGVEGPMTVRVSQRPQPRRRAQPEQRLRVKGFRAPAPETLRIGFASGSDRLSAEGARRLAAFAQDAGDWSFDLSGGASPRVIPPQMPPGLCGGRSSRGALQAAGWPQSG